ncbi:MAG: hypothetical protein OEN20_00750 [Gammaproteobacteria bacterium]|nr:hypothetical protein [Gammaproteobacteria bacterium]
MQVIRFDQNPIIRPQLDECIGTNINGPSLVRTPSWLPEPLGRYYLYFAHHKGRFIRLAYADQLAGPWRVHSPGTLALEQSFFCTSPPPRTVLANLGTQPTTESETDRLAPHIASPDVHIDEAAREIRMYYHGLRDDGSQRTRIAISSDGLHYTARAEILALPYLRAFHYDDNWYGLAMPGVLYRSRDGLTDFERGPQIFGDAMRHAALQRRGNTLRIFWTRVGDAPERILCSTMEFTPDWLQWQASPPAEVLRPETAWEGADLPVEASLRGAINGPVSQLRDPCVFEDSDGSAYLLYAVAGESGIAIASLDG